MNLPCSVEQCYDSDFSWFTCSYFSLSCFFSDKNSDMPYRNFASRDQVSHSFVCFRDIQFVSPGCLGWASNNATLTRRKKGSHCKYCQTVRRPFWYHLTFAQRSAVAFKCLLHWWYSFWCRLWQLFRKWYSRFTSHSSDLDGNLLSSDWFIGIKWTCT